jgi:pimeloyl-ACP methyl ester carboxylesterase
MSKVHIYFMPGLGVGPEIFKKLNLSPEFELHYLEWKKPLHIEETLVNYAMRMADDVKHENPVLIGVSFGGILVQEMSKFIDTKKMIIISSVKSKNEFPKRFKFASVSNIYKLFPTSIITNFEKYSIFFIGKSLKKKAENYKRYLTVRDKTYLEWSFHNVLNWQQETPTKNILHIHGAKDKVFPIKYIHNCEQIIDGDHAMILTKAKKISEIINTYLK